MTRQLGLATALNNMGLIYLETGRTTLVPEAALLPQVWHQSSEREVNLFS